MLETAIPNTFMGPKVTFTRMEDPEAHLTAFHTQMMSVGVEQDALMSPNPRGKLEDLAAGCVCCLVV